ncbi:MAG: hypothetical protein D6782_12540, partial [Alphaproteobacteria bacterium]
MSQRDGPWNAVLLGLAAVFGGALIAAGWLGWQRVDSAHARVWATADAQIAAIAWQEARAMGDEIVHAMVQRWRREGKVPGLFLDDLLESAAPGHDIALRKRRFLLAMVPGTLLVNRLLRGERARLARVAAKLAAGRALGAHERRWLDAMAARYDTEPHQIALLQRRVDIVPPSLVLAQAAIESGWGRSRFARQGNALFGQYSWDGTGMKPKARHAGARHRIKAFDSPAEAILGYMHNLNTHPAYRDFRIRRQALRESGAPLDAIALAGALERYSTLGPKYV